MASLPDEVYDRIKSKLHPSQPEKWKAITHVTLGDVKIYQITEGCYEVDPDFPFHPNDHHQLTLTTEGRLPLMRFGLTLIRLPNSTNVLLDAGLGPWMEDIGKCSGHPVPEKPISSLKKCLGELGLTFDDIHFVILSHCHGDHVGWVGHFSKAIHVLHKKEYDYATYSGCPWANDATARFGPVKEEGRLKLLEGHDIMKIDEEMCPQLSAYLIAGHTPGHICVRIDGSANNAKAMSNHPARSSDVAFYIGDAMHFVCQVANPDLVPLYDCCAWKFRPFLPTLNVQETWMPAMRADPKWGSKTSSEARQKLLQTIAEQKALLLSPHFSPPGMGLVDESDGSFTYLPVSQE